MRHDFPVNRTKRYGITSLLLLCLSTTCLGSQASPDSPPNTPVTGTVGIADPKNPITGNQTQAAAPASSSEATPAAPQHPATRHIWRTTTLDEQVKGLAKALDLTEEQQTGVRRILEHRQRQILQLREDASLSGSDRINRLRGIQHATATQISSLLNEKQKKKYSPLAMQESQKPSPPPDLDYWLGKMTPSTTK